MNNYLYFESIKELRASYYVEYGPPVGDAKFATLSLIFLEPLVWEKVSQHLDDEIQLWIERYPVPLMVWAYDNNDNTIYPPDSNSSCMVAWRNAENAKIEQKWVNSAGLKHFPPASNVGSDWQTIYADIPFRTDIQVKTEASERFSEQVKQNRILKIFLFLWVAAWPAGYAIFEFLGPAWLGAVGLAIVLWKAVHLGLKILGKAKLSPKEAAENEKKRKMEHYFYHCERNPEGFRRLQVENYDIDARNRIREVADELAAKADR